MTIVIAQRRGDTCLIMADTMVSDRNEPGPDVMPGRLKVVTIGHRVTVAYAGNADPAGVAVQEARRELYRNGQEAALEVLKQVSHGGDTDFIVACHGQGASLLRLRNGAALEVQDICSLGDDGAFTSLIEEARVSNGTEPLAKSNLRLGFLDRLMTTKNLGATVGGFALCVDASPTGHRYLSQTGVYTYKFPTLKWGEETHQPIEQVYTGDGHFQCTVMPSKDTDVPVVGVCLLQARTGYIFSPMEHPHAFRVQLAPADTLWEGREQEMYNTLKRAIASHVEAVSR